MIYQTLSIPTKDAYILLALMYPYAVKAYAKGTRFIAVQREDDIVLFTARQLPEGEWTYRARRVTKEDIAHANTIELLYLRAHQLKVISLKNWHAFLDSLHESEYETVEITEDHYE